MGIKFSKGAAKAVKRVARGERDSKYQELIDEVNKLEKGEAITVECPEGIEFAKFYQQMAALRRRVDEDIEPYLTISRTKDGDVAFIHGEEKRPPRKPRKVVKKVTEEVMEEEEEEDDDEEEEFDEEEEEEEDED